MFTKEQDLLIKHVNHPNIQFEKFCHIGLEKEFLRCDPQGQISTTCQPESLGKTLCHPFITTDFLESQVELTTPAYQKISHLHKFLGQLIRHVDQHLDNEVFWPMSMPPPINDPKKLKIACYGSSPAGLEKFRYRKGLAARYGERMQAISGLHYNFSFSNEFWQLLHLYGEEHKEKRSNIYLHIIRNFLRFGPILLYLYGASPCADRSFFDELPEDLSLHKNGMPFLHHGTSMRMSHLGHLPKEQCKRHFTYNDLDSFISAFYHDISTTCDKYSSLSPYQLNDHYLQIPNEHYFYIRPKCSHPSTSTFLDNLKHKGIEYLELRTLDLNPFSPEGVSKQQLKFLSYFFLYCFIQPSPPLSPELQEETVHNFEKVARYGRNPDLDISLNKQSIPFRQFLEQTLTEIDSQFSHLDLKEEYMMMKDSSLTPSARVLQEVDNKEKSYLDLFIDLGKKHQWFLRSLPSDKNLQKQFDAATKYSLAQYHKKHQTKGIFHGFEDMELSTQILLKQAEKRNVKIDIIDRQANLVRLSNRETSTYVQQATKTEKERFVSSLIIQNKSASKKLLKEAQFSVPDGHLFPSYDEAIEAYLLFKDKKVVVKPNSTNFGQGVSFVPPSSINDYRKALHDAFAFDHSVIVEEYIPGNEYRILVIDDEVIGITWREPANIVGDGESTVGELIDKKNQDPESYKFSGTYIQKGKVENNFLKKQNLRFSSVAPKGEKIYLRANSNISTGGDPIDMTDVVDTSYIKIAIEAAQLLKAPICGLDVIIQDVETPATPTNHAILELNINPMLFFHEYPYKGQKRPVGDKVLDFLDLYHS